MDRLEEIRKKDWQLNNHVFPVHSNKQLCKRDIDWLIDEIERLRKEKEEMLDMWYKEGNYSRLTLVEFKDIVESNIKIGKWKKKDIQQALHGNKEQ